MSRPMLDRHDRKMLAVSQYSRHRLDGSMANAIEPYYCEVDAESLGRYRKGGYHPTHLGDTLKDGRF
jgi:hypothetical protein